MSRVMMFANLKGGSAKTTLCVHLAAALQERGQHVLVLDLDPQASATYLSGIDPCNSTAARIIQEHAGRGDFARCVRPSKQGYDVFPVYYECGVLATRIFDTLPGTGEADSALDNYDFVLLDMPPGDTGLLARLAPYAEVLIPAMLTFNGIEGLAHTTGFLAHIATEKNPVRFAGIIPIGIDRLDSHSQQALNELSILFPPKLILYGMHEDSALVDAAWDKTLAPAQSQAAREYRIIAMQLLSQEAPATDEERIQNEGDEPEERVRVFFSEISALLDALEDAPMRNALADRIRACLKTDYWEAQCLASSRKDKRTWSVLRHKRTVPCRCFQLPHKKDVPVTGHDLSADLARLLAQFPDFAFVREEKSLVHAAQSCDERNEKGSALFLYMLATQTRPNAAVYANLGVVLAELGYLEEARTWIYRGCTLFPDDPVLLENKDILNKAS